MNEENRLIENCDLLVSKVEEAREELQKLRNHLDNVLSFGGVE